MASRDIIFEIISHGRMVKICAIDTASGLEATVLGDARAGKAALEKLALRKLEYLRRKQAAQAGDAEG